MVSRTLVDPGAVRYVDQDIEELHSITDGDTVRAFLHRQEPYDEINMHEVYTDRLVLPRGVSLRLIYVDCPDYPDKAGKAAAKWDTVHWFDLHSDKQIRVRTWDGGGFGRYLADVYFIDENGVENSLSQWLLKDANNGKGWPPYIEGQ